MKTVVLLTLALGVILSLGACNTIQGAGRDIRSVGRGIERAGGT